MAIITDVSRSDRAHQILVTLLLNRYARVPTFAMAIVGMVRADRRVTGAFQ